jgi:hypothetical protein
MPVLKNNRHEMFAQMLVEGQRRGWTQGACYSRAGYNAEGMVAEVNASRLLKNAQNGVSQRVSELMAGGVRRAEVTVQSLLHELVLARTGATDDKQFSSAVAAIAGKAKLSGLDNRENSGVGASEFSKCETPDDLMRALLSDQTPAEALASLDELRKEIERFASSRATLVPTHEPARPREPGGEADRSLAAYRRRR